MPATRLRIRTSPFRPWSRENAASFGTGVLRVASLGVLALAAACTTPQAGRRDSAAEAGGSSAPVASSPLRAATNASSTACVELVESTVGPEQRTGLLACPAASDRLVPDLIVRALAPTCADASRIPPPSSGKGPGDDHCRSSAECGNGSACVCRSLDRSAMNAYQNFSRCLPATCRGQADCTEGTCGVSRNLCLEPDGLYCHTPKDECQTSADCGEGKVCGYDTAQQRFACRPWGPCN
jgi:hypothetical protein